jgi:phage gpG-like protein
VIGIELDDAVVQKALNDLARHSGDLTRVMRAIGEYLAETTKRRFDTATAPDGTPWPANRPSTLERYLGRYKSSHTKKGRLSKTGARRAAGKKPLTGETRSLANTIHYSAGRMQVAIGSPMVYSAVQQLGAKKGSFGTVTASVKAHLRTLASGKTAKVKAHTRKQVLPWGDIPARPFLGLGKSDVAAVLDMVERHLLHLTEGA